MVFGSTRPRMEPEFIVSVADALFIRPLIGVKSTVVGANHLGPDLWRIRLWKAPGFIDHTWLNVFEQ